MYGNQDSGEILEEDLAVVLEIMLGVKDVELSGLFLALGRPDTRKIPYGKSLFLCFESACLWAFVLSPGPLYK